MAEEWKDVKGFEGIYQVSSLGRIKSFHRAKKFHCKEEHILNPTLVNTGYYQVTLYGNKKRRKCLVHALVAEAFLPNPEHLPYINHKDENRLNNAVDNLERCTVKYNNNYGTAMLRQMVTKGTPVSQYLVSGHLLATYASSGIASYFTGVKKHQIKDCLQGRCATGGGYVWRYADDLYPHTP